MYLIYQIRLPIVIGESEWCLMELCMCCSGVGEELVGPWTRVWRGVEVLYLCEL